MVMELVEGITLKDYIEKKGKLSAKETISISIQMVTGLQAAHNHHIIHGISNRRTLSFPKKER